MFKTHPYTQYSNPQTFREGFPSQEAYREWKGFKAWESSSSKRKKKNHNLAEGNVIDMYTI